MATKFCQNSQAIHKVTGSQRANALKRVLDILKDIDTPRALTVYLLASHGQWRDVVSLEIKPSDYNDPSSFFLDYQATKLFSKTVGLPTGIDTKSVALDKWIECESQNAITNKRISELMQDPLRDPEVCLVFHLAARKIHKILGAVDLDYIFENSRFGPGATLSTNQDVSTLAKFEAKADVSPSCLPYAIAYRKFNTQWHPQEYHLVDYNRLTFVPKTSKTDRPISVEPHMNIFFQLGAGRLIRKRLCKVGLDLDHAAGVHRRFAAEGSLDSSLATIDLSSASDTISSRLVLELLPENWFTLLDDLRSKNAKLPSGEVIHTEKFSSMGNGYTFELETLIFYGLVTACAQLCGDSSPISVFGDDIICGRVTAALFVKLLASFGFTPNRDKTYLDGNFRESCGFDAFLGYNVRPFFLKELPYDSASIFKLVNGISEMASRYYDCSDGRPCVLPVIQACKRRDLPAFRLIDLPDPPTDPKIRSKRFRGSYESVSGILPSSKRYYVPIWIGRDCGIWGDSSHRSVDVYRSLRYVSTKYKARSCRPGLHLHALYNAGSGVFSDQEITLRGRGRYVVVKHRDSFRNFYYGGWE